MFNTIIGHSEHTDTFTATRSVIEQCLAQLGDILPSAGIVFASSWYDHKLILAEMGSTFPGLPISGCSSGGELTSVSGFRDDSICLVLFVSDSINMAAGIGLEVSQNPIAAARHAVQMAKSDLAGEPRLCLAFPDNLQASPTKIIDTLDKELGPGCQIFGGFAAAVELGADEVSQFHKDKVYSDAVSILLFAGPIETAFKIINSSIPVGERTTIDEVDGNSVTRIGGRSALSFYRHTFGPHTKPLLEMPISIVEESGETYIRAPVSFDEVKESVQFYGSINKGSVVQFTEETPEGIIADTDLSIEELLKSIGNEWTPQAAMFFSCGTRKWILSSQANEESSTIQKKLPEGTPFAGFYSYGEIAPLTSGQSTKYHNCTMVALLLGEKESTQKPIIHREPAIDSMRSMDKALQIDLMERSLFRSNAYLTRLEKQKALSGRMLKRLNNELQHAKNKIEKQNRILQESLTLAQEVQQSLIPNQAPSVDHFDIAGSSLYCDETGGDYLDYLKLEDGIAVVVGDVSGHGIAAALLMTTARALLRMRADIGGRPSDLITDLNRLLAHDVQESGRFMTLMYLIINRTTLKWVRAGHEPGLRFNPDTGAFTDITGEGMALGIFEDVVYEEFASSPLKPGEMIVLLSDGITETRDSRGRLFGRERLKEIIQENAMQPAISIVEACLQEVGSFRAEMPREDDETIIVIKAR